MTALLALARLLPLKSWLILGAALALLLSLGFCAVQERRLSEARQEAAAARAQAAALAKDQAARDRAADQRLADALSNATLKENLNAAVASLPDAVPSDRRIGLACQRLRNQGADTSSLTACAGLGG